LPKDQRLATEWYRKAAEQGNASAQNNLGVCYKAGTCMPKHLVAAYALYNLAASAGIEVAKENLTSLEESLSDADRRKGQDLGTKLYSNKTLLATLDAYVKANPWKEPKVAQPALPLPQQPRPKTTSTTRQTNRTSCTNECFNGSCVRKFPDGSTERWQAPRKLDPFTQNWGWDTSTNACGL
jgi:hypothetical protein